MPAWILTSEVSLMRHPGGPGAELGKLDTLFTSMPRRQAACSFRPERTSGRVCGARARRIRQDRLGNFAKTRCVTPRVRDIALLLTDQTFFLSAVTSRTARAAIQYQLPSENLALGHQRIGADQTAAPDPGAIDSTAPCRSASRRPHGE